MWSVCACRAFSPDLVHVIQAMETGLRSEADMSKAIEALQVTEVRRANHKQQATWHALTHCHRQAEPGARHVTREGF